MRFLTRSATAFLASIAVPAVAVAQNGGMPVTPAFQAVIRLAQDGFGDSARTTIGRIIDRTPPTDASYPEALYTAATVAKSGEEMRLLFSRVSVEYSRSPWADNALLRLAQLDYGAGNLDGVLARVRRLMGDYPNSPVLPIAALWGSRAAFERGQMATGCEWVGRGIATAGNDVETRNQLEFSRARCSGTPQNAPPSTAVAQQPPPPQARTTPPAGGESVNIPVARPPATAERNVGGGWRVQVGALSDAGAIRRTRQAIEGAGFTAYSVAGPNGLTKVQAGPFNTREDAQASLVRVKAAVNGDAFVTRAP